VDVWVDTVDFFLCFSVSYSPRLHLFDQKYCQNYKIVKYSHILKCNFKIFKILFKSSASHNISEIILKG